MLGVEDEQKIALLLHSAGVEAIDVFNSFALTDAESTDYQAVLQKFGEYCSPKKNEIFERYVFQNRTQNENESVEKFSADLKILAKTCNYGSLKDSMIRDQIVFGLFDKKLTEKLLRIKDLTLENAICLVQAAEVTQTQMAKLRKGATSNHSETAEVKQVDAIRGQPDRKRTDFFDKGKSGNNKYRKHTPKKCMKCGYVHERAKCRAYGKTCHVCGMKNHFASLCRNKKSGNINMVENNYEKLGDVMEDLRIDSITGKDKVDEWFLPILMNGTSITFKLDTGAQMDIIPYDTYVKLKPRPEYKNYKKMLTGYDNGVIKTHGFIDAQLMYKNKTCSATVAVAKGKRVPLLGLKSCVQLGLVKRINNLVESNIEKSSMERMLKKYNNIFKGTGCVKQKYKILLKDNSVPVIQAPRRIAFSIRDRLKKQLNTMIEMGIIKKIDTPTEWVSSLVIVEKKNGLLRVCLDPKDLNECIKREHYQIPTKEEIQSELAGACVFSTLDVQNGFYQIPLDEESAKLCTFNTPFGRHCFVRMPFGITSAPEVFQRILNNIYEGLEGIRIYIDDIIIWGRNEKEHDERLEKVLQRTAQAGITLNKEKCHLKKNEIIFLGEQISKSGIKPNNDKVEDMLKMRNPKDKTEIKKMLGLVNYLGKFIPNLSNNTVALRSLLKNSTAWSWEMEHEKEFRNLKKVLISEPILQLYDPQKKTKISTDASSYGIGAVLLQLHGTIWKPVAYASRSLTDTESRYAQIEKESLGLVFGCDRFRDFVYGRNFTLETDHKPLLAMTKRSIANIPPRIQRMFLRLQRYRFKLEHVPGKQLIIADTLSRMVETKQASRAEEVEDIQIHVNTVVTTLPIEDKLLEKIRVETEKDPVLQQVKAQLGKKSFEGLAVVYRRHRDITEYKGLLLKGSRVIVPRSLQNSILKKVHEGHLGIEKNKRRAREAVFWNNINADIKGMVDRCEKCQTYAHAKVKEPLLSTKAVQKPWYQVATDLFYWKGKYHIVVMDYYSCYPLVAKLKSTNADTVIKYLKNVFSMFGIPNKMVSDNGPPFSSKEFKDFMNEYNFQHVTSSPGYPQGNGMAEKAVQIAKNILRKTGEDGDAYLGFLSYRTTPMENRKSPAELLMKRKLRTSLPQINKSRAKVPSHKRKQKFYYDQQAKIQEELKKDDIVRLRDIKSNLWSQKAIIKEMVSPRSYKVVTENNVEYRRNAHHLRKTEEPFVEKPTMTIEDLEEPPSQGENKVVETKGPSVEKPTKSEDEAQVELRRSTRIRKPPNRLDW